MENGNRRQEYTPRFRTMRTSHPSSRSSNLRSRCGTDLPMEAAPDGRAAPPR
jgi:hypothetical protein